MRIGILGIIQESNTFLEGETTIEHFRQTQILTGDEIRESFQEAHHEIGGFFEEIDRSEFTAVPIFFARALPYGAITDEAYAELVEMLEQELSKCEDLDGVLVACHGANVAQSTRDVDGDWLSRIRAHFGANVPIISTLDPHANLSEQMVSATDALIVYRTNPHLDQRQRGVEAATLLRRTLRGEIRPTQAACFPPLVINIERQATSEAPCCEHFARADRQLERPGVLSNSILLGFPYADVPEMGSAVLAVTDGDPDLAAELASELAAELWRDRERFVADLMEVPVAIEGALALDGPVCLLDMGDNVGGGSPADSTILARALHERGAERSLVCLFDPETVVQAEAAGPGARLSCAVGGKSDSMHGEPLEAEFTVKGLHDGEFTESEPRHGGVTEFDQGRTAVLETDGGLTLLVTSERMVPFSLGQLTSCELDPSSYHILVAKGVNAPIAAYAPVCKHFIRVDTPGVTTADMTRFDYEHRRRPLFPFERDFEWTPGETF
jgi:microcystin degradation protein MlrC